MRNRNEIALVIVAAGRGERAGSPQDGPKQYRRIGGVPIVRHTLDAFARAGLHRVVVAIHADDAELFPAAAGPHAGHATPVVGGATRQASTLQALRALDGPDAPSIVLIHDAVRPFIDAATVAKVIETAADGVGALPAIAVADTLKRQSADGLTTVDRANLYAAQTPQGFPYGAILDAHERAAAAGRSDFTDDAAIAEWAGLPVRLVEGSTGNVKLTYAKDLQMAEERLARASAFPDVRTGNGYDVHAFEPGDAVTLCGVRIPYDRKLSGHSDADVGLHALTDALLATCGAGDIGTHFPPSDPQWKGAASRLFVEHAAATVRARGGRIANADVTLIAEAPKVGPHRAAMTEAMAAMLSISPDRVSIKATTNERLGFIGREEGIAAIATATVVYPGELDA